MLRPPSIRVSLATASLLLAVCVQVDAEDWPQWRGPHRDGVAHETGLLKEWPEGGPPIVWQVETAGVGYSSMSVKDGRVMTQGDLDGVEHIICFNEKDGALLWAVQPEPVQRALQERVDSQFDRFDRNADGRLDEAEALSALGRNALDADGRSEGDPQEIAAKRVAALFQEFDANRDGTLTAAEFPPAFEGEIARIDRPDPNADNEALAHKRTADLLTRADQNGDGEITRQEARREIGNRLFRQIDQRDPATNRPNDRLTEEEIRTYFLRREPGQDGQITPQELETFFAREYPGRDGVLVKADLYRQLGGYRNNRGDGPRGTPTIDGERVYAEGGNGDVTCLDAATGKTMWHVNLVSDLHGDRPNWGYSESPLIVGDWVIVTPGGNGGTVAALNKQNGTVVWRSADMTQRAHYSSPVFAEIAGVPQIVQFGRESVFGVALDGGRFLWSYSAPANGTANCATPIVFGDYVLSSSAYGTGTGTVKITNDSPTEQKAEEVYFQPRLANHHGGLVKIGEYVYGFGRGLTCMNFLTGKFAWQAGSVRKGSLVCADGMLYCLGEGHEMALVEATPDEYREHGRFRIENFGRPSWAHPVVANGRLYVRNQHRLTAYNVRAR